MSSGYVRNQIIGYLQTELPTEKILDISAEFENIQDFLSANGVRHTEPWIGLTFLGGEESPMGLVADGLQGKYREIGSVEIHIVAKSKIGIGASIITRADAVVNSLRGRRIGDILIESIVQPNFGTGSTMDFEAGMTSAVVLAAFQRDLDL
jgi:hypothetical protein